MLPIVIINPNSTEAVTEGMRAAVKPLLQPGGPRIECVTLTDGPPGIETDQHVAQAAAPICEVVRARQDTASAFVIGCYSDPGVRQARAIGATPVFGIAESAMLTAMTRGERFGILSILEQSIPRHDRYVRELGFEKRAAGDRAIGLGVAELADGERTFARLLDVATRLRDEDRADVLILGCAGMARYRGRLEERVGVPVVEPTQAATAFALSSNLLGES
jgi:Asp/Glu/hydantoin racemase